MSGDLSQHQQEYNRIVQHEEDPDTDSEPPTPGSSVILRNIGDASKKKELPAEFHQNLDQLYQYMYKYFLERGFLSIILLRLTKLLTIFLLVLSPIFILIINWREIGTCEKNCSFLVWSNLTSFEKHNFIFFGLAIIGIVFWLYKAIQCARDLMKYYHIKHIYNQTLEIDEYEIETVTWNEVMERINKLFFSQYRCEVIDSINIMNRIMRYENFIIALVQEDVLDLTLFSNVPLWTEAMVWNLKGIVTSCFNQETFQLIEDGLSVTRLRARIFYYGVYSIIASPFVFIYFVMFYFLKYFARFKNEPGALTDRKWTTYALWKMRYLNELPHFFDKRMADSYHPSMKYIRQFPSRTLSIISKFLMFLTSTISVSIVFVGIVKPNGLMTITLFGYNLTYWLTIMLVIWVGLRGMAIDKNTIFKPNKQMEKIVKITGYCPPQWKKNDALMAHTPRVLSDFKQLFQNHIVVFLQEICSIFTTPYFLLTTVQNSSSKIYAFLKENTIFIPKVGDVCKSSNFNKLLETDEKMNQSFAHYQEKVNEEMTETHNVKRAKRELFESRIGSQDLSATRFQSDISVTIEK